MGVGPKGKEGELVGLFGHDLCKLGTAVADLDDEESGKAVEVPLALVVPDVCAVTPSDDGDVSRHRIRMLSDA